MLFPSVFNFYDDFYLMTHSQSAFVINCHLRCSNNAYLRKSTHAIRKIVANTISDKLTKIIYIYICILTFPGQAFLEIEKHRSLSIKISGACCKLPDPISTINFESFVREKQTRSVIIMNDSNAPWRLKIEVKGDYFSADQLLQIPPLQLAPCVVTYAPIVMNTDETLNTVKG